MGSLAVIKIKSVPRGQECGGDRVSQDSVEVNLQVLSTHRYPFNNCSNKHNPPVIDPIFSLLTHPHIKRQE